MILVRNVFGVGRRRRCQKTDSGATQTSSSKTAKVGYDARVAFWGTHGHDA